MARLPRHLLPQIPKDKIGEFCKFVQEHGISVRLRKVPVSKLKPIQSEVNAEKVEKMKRDPKILKQPLLASKEGFVMDGHHRYVALTELDPEMLANVLLCHCSIRKLVELGHQFDGSFTKTVHESTIYGKTLWEDDDTEEEALPIVRKTLYPY